MPPINGMPGQIPLIGRQGPSREQQIHQNVMAGMNQLATAIYTQLAIAEFNHPDTVVTPEGLRQLARDARMAAQCYFEGLGITFEQKT